MPPTCHVDLDSLWMLPWNVHTKVETGPRAEVWDWRSVLCNVARLSRMPVFQDTDFLKGFCNVGKSCLLDLNVRGTYPCVGPPECSLETVAQMPPIPYCRVVERLSNMVAQRRGCTRIRRKWTFLGRDTGCVGFPMQDEIRGRPSLYKA